MYEYKAVLSCVYICECAQHNGCLSCAGMLASSVTYGCVCCVQGYGVLTKDTTICTGQGG